MPNMKYIAGQSGKLGESFREASFLPSLFHDLSPSCSACLSLRPLLMSKCTSAANIGTLACLHETKIFISRFEISLFAGWDWR